jgi:hypothetical protein
MADDGSLLAPARLTDGRSGRYFRSYALTDVFMTR